MSKLKSNDFLDKNLQETFKDVSFPHKFLTGHLTILKKYTKDGEFSGLNDLDYLNELDRT